MARYMVFARTEYAEPLEHRGDVEAGGADEAKDAALESFGADWLEMSLVPADEVFYAQRSEEGSEVEA